MSGWVDCGSGGRTRQAVGSWTPIDGIGAGGLIVDAAGWGTGVSRLPFGWLGQCFGPRVGVAKQGEGGCIEPPKPQGVSVGRVGLVAAWVLMLKYIRFRRAVLWQRVEEPNGCRTGVKLLDVDLPSHLQGQF